MNPILIEQSPEETKLAFEVHRNASIEKVRLSRTKSTALSAEAWADAQITVGFNFKTKELAGPERVMRLEISFRMKGTRSPEETDDGSESSIPEPNLTQPNLEQLIAIECAFEVDYALQDDFVPSPEHVKAFREGNAVFNVWPFFREYLHSQMQRMGLPPLTAPFLRIVPKPKKVARRERQVEAADAQEV
jgi:hypothetical protein